MLSRFLFLCSVMTLAACGDPLFVFPGGALTGESAAPPPDWSAVADEDVIQVEFRPSDPYSHNIWAVGLGADLYIATSAEGTRWTPFIDADPRVRVRVQGAIHDLVASAVGGEGDERGRVAAAYTEKYDIDEEDNWVTDALIYRLDRP